MYVCVYCLANITVCFSPELVKDICFVPSFFQDGRLASIFRLVRMWLAEDDEVKYKASLYRKLLLIKSRNEERADQFASVD